ncbi:MAG: PEP-CTERM sorting domain-containing protein [Rubrivivax sp.]|nr:PEP-CTERM sorting domain-containing protein [Rubrivivax sp.]
MRDDLVVEFTARFIDSSPLIEGSLRSPMMVSVSFGNHVGASMIITERAASFNYGHDQQVAPGAQLDPLVFYDHRLVFSGTTTEGTVTHYTNGELRYRMPLQQNTSLFSADARIQFGDMTDQFGGTSEWLRFAYHAAPVPEPGAMAMLLAGLAVVGGIARRRGGVTA